jgi:short-subunit dehydrogenase
MSAETVLVTGASSGIGLELARCFAAEGCRLILLARKRQALEALAEELRGAFKTHSEVLPADLAEPAAPARIFGHLEAHGTRVDVLVNNAGFGARGTFAQVSLQRQLEMVQVNLTALTHLTGLFLPGMIARRRGGILNVASTAAFQPGPGMAVYFATKSYVLSFSEALAEELIGTGLTVSALCPGPTNTNFTAVAGERPSEFLTRTAMSAQEVARIGHQGYRQGRFVVVPGFRNRLLAVGARLGPRALVRKIVKRVNATDSE